MSLYDVWNEKFNADNAANIEAYITEYYKKEKNAYASILSEGKSEVKTTVAAFAEKYGMADYEVTGFVDGINTSLEEEIDPASLEKDTEFTLKIKWDALYINMHKAKASWLYELPEWDNINTAEERAEMLKAYHRSVQAVCTKVGRNSPCPCGSGKKYKNCCGKDA